MVTKAINRMTRGTVTVRSKRNKKVIREVAAAGRGLFKGKKLLIFDFDGTLADTSGLHARAFTEVLRPYGIDVEYEFIAGIKTRDAMEKCLAVAGIVLTPDEIHALVTAKQRHSRALIRRELKAFEGVDEFLRKARPLYRLALYSSASRETIDISMERLGYKGWFDPEVSSEDVARGKPHPEGYLMILGLTKTPACEAIVFEDSEAGILSATRAGITTVDVKPPFNFKSLIDLL